MASPRAVLLSLFCLAATAPAVLAQDLEPDLGPDQFSSAEAGFKIEKPDPAWALSTQDGATGISSLAMGPPELNGLVRFSIEISPATNPDIEALTQQRDELLAQIEGIEDIRSGKPIEGEVAGIPAPGLQVEQDALGTTFLVRQYYVLAQGIQYKIQVNAPKDRFDEFQPLFQQAIDSFAIVKLGGKARAEAEVRALAARCGSEVDWITEWEAASHNAQRQGKLIVVAVQAVSGFDIGDPIGAGPFMDLDVLRLLQHRFVVLRWRRGMGAPFEDYEVFGMGPSTFGTGLLVVTPDGKVVRQVYAMESTAVYDVLLSTLQGHPRLAAPPAAAPERQGQIEFLLHSGQLQQADALLASADSSEDPAREAALRGLAQRLRRNGDAALQEYEAALAIEMTRSERSSAAQMELLLEVAKVLTAIGQAEEAEHRVDTVLAAGTKTPAPVYAEALLVKGSLRLQAEDRDGCAEHWKELMREHPQSRWSWLVAAAMTGPGWGLDVWPDLRWPQPERSRLIHLPAPAAEAGLPLSNARLISSAADYLIDGQQKDGSWLALTAYGDRKPLGDDFDMAATVIGGRALLAMPEHPGARQAAFRAMNWVIDQHALLEQLDTYPVVFMDYTVWSRSYAIFFLADCLDAGLAEDQTLRPIMQDMIQELTGRQQANGGWSYYLTGQAGGEAVAQAISFTTATVVMALQRAADVGCRVPDSVLDRGLTCLEVLRSPEGTFAYFLFGSEAVAGQPLQGTNPEGSAGRGPVCSLALLRGGREKAAELVPRFQLYVDHLAGFGAQRRKALMHAGAHTQGSHYLMYDYSTAAEALREVGNGADIPAALREQVRRAIMLEVRQCRNADGSYVDNPLIGVDIATGLALSAMLDLKAEAQAAAGE